MSISFEVCDKLLGKYVIGKCLVWTLIDRRWRLSHRIVNSRAYCGQIPRPDAGRQNMFWSVFQQSTTTSLCVEKYWSIKTLANMNGSDNTYATSNVQTTEHTKGLKVSSQVCCFILPPEKPYANSSFDDWIFLKSEWCHSVYDYYDKIPKLRILRLDIWGTVSVFIVDLNADIRGGFTNLTADYKKIRLDIIVGISQPNLKPFAMSSCWHKSKNTQFSSLTVAVLYFKNQQKRWRCPMHMVTRAFCCIASMLTAHGVILDCTGTFWSSEW